MCVFLCTGKSNDDDDQDTSVIVIVISVSCTAALVIALILLREYRQQKQHREMSHLRPRSKRQQKANLAYDDPIFNIQSIAGKGGH